MSGQPLNLAPVRKTAAIGAGARGSARTPPAPSSRRSFRHLADPSRLQHRRFSGKIENLESRVGVGVAIGSSIVAAIDSAFQKL